MSVVRTASRYGFPDAPRHNSMGHYLCTCGTKKKRLETEDGCPPLYEFRCGRCAWRVSGGDGDGRALLLGLLEQVRAGTCTG